MGKKLFQIKALKTFWSVEKWELGWYIESEKNLAQVSGNAWVYGDAWVYGNARVYGDAWVSAKKSFTKGWFIGGDDSWKLTKLTHEQIGNNFWESNYVLGDYEITDIEEEKVEESIEEITLEEVCKRLGKNIKIIK